MAQVLEMPVGDALEGEPAVAARFSLRLEKAHQLYVPVGFRPRVGECVGLIGCGLLVDEQIRPGPVGPVRYLIVEATEIELFE